jgi:hypothetical protein
MLQNALWEIVIADWKVPYFYDMARSGELSPEYMALGRWLRQEHHEHHLNKNDTFLTPGGMLQNALWEIVIADWKVPYGHGKLRSYWDSPRVHFGAFLQALGMYVEAG